MTKYKVVFSKVGFIQNRDHAIGEMAKLAQTEEWKSRCQRHLSRVPVRKRGQFCCLHLKFRTTNEDGSQRKADH
jgi:hypothetical protein